MPTLIYDTAGIFVPNFLFVNHFLFYVCRRKTCSHLRSLPQMLSVLAICPPSWLCEFISHK